MAFTVVALAVGLGLGFATGGRPANIGKSALRLVWLLSASVGLQVLAELLPVSATVGLSMMLASYVGLSAFAIANIRLVGMPVVLVGLVLNLVVIALNGGMPVRASSVIASHAASASELPSLDFGAKRHLADGDTLAVLGDIIPVRPSREVLSFGDLILAFGIADVLFRLLKPVDVRRRREDVVGTKRLAPARRPRELIRV